MKYFALAFLVSVTVTLGSRTAKGADFCETPLVESSTFENLRDKITTCKIDKIEDVIPLLSKEHRANYTLMYLSASIQASSVKAPRAILYGETAKLVIAFNGEPYQTGYNSLELIQFRDTTKNFEFRKIDFPSHDDSDRTVKFSEANPSLCLSCHRSDPRPNWDGYFVWPGAFGSEDDSFYRKGYSLREFQEKVLYREYEAGAGGHPRYKYLTGPTGSDFSSLRNAKLTNLLSSLNEQKIARELATEKSLGKFRYALLGAATCRDVMRDNFESFIPAAVRSKFAKTWKQLYDDTYRAQKQSFLNRVQELNAINSWAPEEDRVKTFADALRRNSYYDIDNTWQVASSRYVYENVMGKVMAWSLEPSSLSYVFEDGLQGIYNLRFVLPDILLTEQSDADLRAAYRPVHDISGSSITTWSDDRICRELKRRSLRALSP